MKYIIKNCDNYTNFDEDWTCRSTIQNRKGCYCCQDINDCFLKQIVEICKYKPPERIFNGAENIKIGYEMAQMAYANEILGLLEIEECE